MVLKTAIQNLTTLRGFILLDLKKFNASNGLGMDNWKDLFDKNIMDRQIIDFVLSEKRTTAILRYYDEPGGLRNTLEPLTYEKRVMFLDDFGDESLDFFNLFKQRPNKIIEWSNGNGFARNILKDAKYFWLKLDFNYDQIKDLYSHLYEVRSKIVEPNKPQHNIAYDWIKNYSESNKSKALKYLGNADRVTVGNYIEKPAINFIKRNLISDEKGFVSVDIKFYDKNGKLLNKGSFRDIDGMILKNNQFENIKSCKLPINATKWEKERDILLAYKNIPNSNIYELRDFLSSNSVLKNIANKDIKSLANSFEFEMIDVSTGQKIFMNPSEFQQKIKSNYFQSNIQEINPSTLNTTKEEIIEATYQYLHTKYNQPLNWD